MARIVIADDDDDIRDLVLFKLRHMGHVVEPYVNGVLAVEAVTADPPDLVILDMMMPGLSGLDATRALRKEPALRDLPIMLLTARAQESDITTGREAGADDYVTKPFTMGDFSARVEKLLAAGSARREAQHES